MKKLKLSLASMFLLSSLFISCSEDNNSNENNTQQENNSQKSLSAVEEYSDEDLQAFKVSYDINGGEAAREEASVKLYEMFAEKFLMKSPETDGEIISYVFSDDMIHGVLSIENLEVYRPSLMNEQQQTFFYAFGGDSQTNEVKAGGYYTAACDGGKNDGKTMEFNGAGSRAEAKELGKKLQKFTSDCTKGGGCVNICKTAVVIKK